MVSRDGEVILNYGEEGEKYGIIMEGLLHKRGKMRKNIQSRYFRLCQKPLQLFYYLNNDAKRAKGVIPLFGPNDEPSEVQIVNGSGLEIKTTDRTYECFAESDHIAKRWKKAIQKLIKDHMPGEGVHAMDVLEKKMKEEERIKQQKHVKMLRLRQQAIEQANKIEVREEIPKIVEEHEPVYEPSFDPVPEPEPSRLDSEEQLSPSELLGNSAFSTSCRTLSAAKLKMSPRSERKVLDVDSSTAAPWKSRTKGDEETMKNSILSRMERKMKEKETRGGYKDEDEKDFAESELEGEEAEDTLARKKRNRGACKEGSILFAIFGSFSRTEK